MHGYVMIVGVSGVCSGKGRREKERERERERGKEEGREGERERERERGSLRERVTLIDYYWLPN